MVSTCVGGCVITALDFVMPAGCENRYFHNLPFWFYAGFPAVLAVFSVTITLLDPTGYTNWVKGELGVIEMLTAFMMLPTCLLVVLALRKRHVLPSPFLTLWLYMLLFGAIFFAGEELSWGQHLLGLTTPDIWMQYNEQQEINLHNVYYLEFLADYLPRALLTLGALVAIILPMWLYKKNIRLDPRTNVYAWIWPTCDCTTVAILMFALRLPEKILESFGFSVPFYFELASGGEMKECMLSLMILIYTASFYMRLRQLECKRK